jgi:hypothetical protein
VVPAESVEPEPVARDRSARIAQAQAPIDAEIAAERAEREDMVQQHLARIAARRFAVAAGAGLQLSSGHRR